MVSSSDFAAIFLSKVGKDGATVLEIEQSKTDAEFGESDMTVIFSVGGKKHALLIEDKIDAVAMPKQCERYFKRGERGKENGEYDDFDVFIIAPQKYLDENEEAGKYPNKVTYEECADFFADREDKRSSFKLQQIQQAIYKQKHGYQLIENVNVTAFWDKYISYQEKQYPELWITNKRGKKGFWARWAYFRTVINGVLIYHKTECGYMDMTLEGLADKTIQLEQLLEKNSIDLKERGMCIVQTGKSAAIRLRVPVVDFTKLFENYEREITMCFDAAVELNNLAKEMSVKEDIVALIEVSKRQWGTKRTSSF